MVNPYSELEITKTHKDMASVPINSDRLSRHHNHHQIRLKVSKYNNPIASVQALANLLQLRCSKVNNKTLQRFNSNHKSRLKTLFPLQAII